MTGQASRAIIGEAARAHGNHGGVGAIHSSGGKICP